MIRFFFVAAICLAATPASAFPWKGCALTLKSFFSRDPLGKEISLSGLNKLQIESLKAHSRGVISFDEFSANAGSYAHHFAVGIWGDHKGSRRNEFLAQYNLIHPKDVHTFFRADVHYHPAEYLVADLKEFDIPTVVFVPRQVLSPYKWSHDHEKLSITGQELRAFLNNPESMTNVVFVFGALKYSNPFVLKAKYRTD